MTAAAPQPGTMTDTGSAPSDSAGVNQELRTRLLRMKDRDQRVRARLLRQGALFERYAKEMEAVHLEHAVRLNEIVERHGWPGESLVGVDGAEGAWLVAQHAISSPALQRRNFDALQSWARSEPQRRWRRDFGRDSGAELVSCTVARKPPALIYCALSVSCVLLRSKRGACRCTSPADEYMARESPPRLFARERRSDLPLTR